VATSLTFIGSFRVIWDPRKNEGGGVAGSNTTLRKVKSSVAGSYLTSLFKIADRLSRFELPFILFVITIDPRML
jgi:hypothetical protein